MQEQKVCYNEPICLKDKYIDNRLKLL